MRSEVEFIFHGDAKKIFDTFTRVFGIRIVFFSLAGKPLTSGSNKKNCLFCRMMRVNLNYEPDCKKLDRKKMMQAAKHKRLVTYTCHGGMVEAVLPVYTVDKLIGYIMIGQFRTSNGMPTSPRNVWKILTGNDKLYDAFLAAPLYPKKRVKDILNLFSLLVEMIVTRHLITTSSYSSIHKLISYIDQNPQANLTLADAAQMLDCSVSSISHAFRKTTGKAFKEYIISRKLDKADELLARKSMKIHEISDAVGYWDPYFFSRIYKKYRGRAPKFSGSKS